jgi:(S)-2-hydroxyglutarate dehydrogenase
VNLGPDSPMNQKTALPQTTDIVIIGAGIVGLSVACRLKQDFPDLSITLLEKETALARHASGRKSGVIHSGIYYSEDSLKARLCAQGAKALAAYCEENSLPLKRLGKIILPVKEADDAQLNLLLHRAERNGCQAKMINANQLAELEPESFSLLGKALLVPETAVFDPVAIVQCLAKELQTQGVSICLGQHVQRISPKERQLQTPSGALCYGFLINTAGLHADIVAKAFHVGEEYRILPFKGLYYKLSPSSSLKINRLLYPVPDLRVPFLGVHFTRSCHEEIYVGPTAIPAFGREHYHFLEGLDFAEAPDICLRILQQYRLNKEGFRHFTHQEAFRFFKPMFVKAAQAMVPKLRSQDLVKSTKVGIRAQLLNIRTRTMEHDFRVIDGEHSVHILNAVSPAFTSAFAFARHVVEHHLDSAMARC